MVAAGGAGSPQAHSPGIASRRDLDGWLQRWLNCVGSFVFLRGLPEDPTLRNCPVAPLQAFFDLPNSPRWPLTRGAHNGWKRLAGR
jgi:hypothetical protein